MFGYIYLVTNNINNKKYIGKREKSVFDENYWGSGKYIRNAINKYGKENFSRQVLAWASTKEELYELEKKYIDEYNAVKSSEYYNLTPGGLGGGSCGKDNGAYGKHWYTDGNSQVLCFEENCPDGWYLGCSESRKKISQRINLGKKFSDEHKQKISEAHKKNPSRGMLGKHQSDYQKKIVREINKGKEIPLETRIKISSTLIASHKNGWVSSNKGRSLSDEHRKHISESKLGKSHLPLNQESRRKIGIKNSIAHKGRIFINNGEECLQIYPDQLDSYIEKGYIKGRLMSKDYQAHNKGRICINNGLKNKYIFQEELNDYISLGYIKGKLSKKNNPLEGEGAKELYEEFEQEPF